MAKKSDAVVGDVVVNEAVEADKKEAKAAAKSDAKEEVKAEKSEKKAKTEKKADAKPKEKAGKKAEAKTEEKAEPKPGSAEEPIEEEINAVPEEVEEVEEKKPRRRGRYEEDEEEKVWEPKTRLGEMTKAGKITIGQIFEGPYVIREPEIVDCLLPGLEENTMLIGGSPGKGGGIQRRPSRRTVRVHKSGRRTNISMMTIVGHPSGYLGIGVGKASANRAAREKSLNNAKLNIFPVKKGCGSWECGCGEGHSIPFMTKGKCGSVEVKLMPAPRGLGLCASDEMKKIFQAVGIKDIRLKSRGQTHSRTNFIFAIEDALKNINRMKV
ncbi:MAG: 30S ribosomal protein S5 [Candidatus Aenigmatarchaeota archaeon]